MEWILKVFLIGCVFFSFNSFAVKAEYVSVFKPKVQKVQNVLEFQNKMRKDFLEIKRGLAGASSVQASAKIKEEKKNIKPSFISPKI